MAFHEYKEQEENNFNELGIKNNILGTLNLYRFLGNIFEVYLPQLFNVVVEMSKGSEEEDDTGTDQDKSPRVNFPV
ncbi:MAG: hypothetical protein AAF849_08500 [Bacteroidota bacterium]